MRMKTLVELISEITGEKYVSDKEHVRWSYARDVGPWRERMPDVVVRPADPFEASSIVKLANRLSIPIWPRGGGATPVGAGMPLTPNGILLDIRRLDGLEIDEDDMMVVAESGVNWGKLINELWKKNLDTFRGPGSGHAATVGGSASMASNWHATAKYGGMGDVVRGLEVILPTGEIINTSSASKWPHKFFARYGGGPDVTGLFIGDHGTLGIKTKVSLGLWEKPEFVSGIAWGADRIEDMENTFRSITSKRLATDINYHDKLIVQFYEYIRTQIGFDGVGPEMRRVLKGLYEDAEESRTTEKLKNADIIALAIVEETSQKLTEEKMRLIKHIIKENNGWIIGQRYAMDYKENQLHGFYHFFMNVDPGLGGAFIGMGGLVRTSQFAKCRKILYDYLEENKEDLEKYEISGTLFGYVFGPSSVAAYPGLLGDLYHLPSRERIVYHTKRIRDYYLKSDSGWQPYFIGEFGSEGFVKTWYGLYYETLRRIKKLLDPNGILNPGMLGL